MRLRTTDAIKRAEIPRSSFRTVDALLEATNRRLAALTESEARQLWPVIEDALRGVTGRIGTGAGKFTEHDARVMRLQLLQIKQQLAERIGMQLAKSDTKAQFAAVADMRHEVAALSKHFGQPRTLDIDTVLTVTDTSNLLVQRIAKAAAKRSRETIQATAATLGSAAAQGLSFRDAGKLLESRLGVEAYKAERLARTELVFSHNLQRFEVADAEGYGLLWNSATYRACDICRALDEQYAPHGKSFPGGVMHAPAHPNCKCSCVLWRPEWSSTGRAAPPAAPRMPPASAPFHERAMASARRVTGAGAPFELPWEKQVLIHYAGTEHARHYGGGMRSFKADLLAAHRAGELQLVRADLAGAISPNDFDAALVRTPQGAEFHLIRVPKED